MTLPDPPPAMVSDFEIMTKAREVKELAVEMELVRTFAGTEVLGSPELPQVIGAGFDDILAGFDRFTGSDSSGREALAATLTQLRNQLTEAVLADVDHVGTRLSGWSGPPDGAAAAFRGNFLERLPGCLRNQVGLINELDGALRTAETIAATSQRDLLTIADKTIIALRHTATGGVGPSVIVLTVPNVTAAPVASVPGGLGPVMEFALTGRAGDLAVTGLSPEVAAASGATPREVVNSMHAAIDKLVEATRAKDKALAAALRTDLQTAESVRGTHLEPDSANRPRP